MRSTPRKKVQKGYSVWAFEYKTKKGNKAWAGRATGPVSAYITSKGHPTEEAALKAAYEVCFPKALAEYTAHLKWCGENDRVFCPIDDFDPDIPDGAYHALRWENGL